MKEGTSNKWCQNTKGGDTANQKVAWHLHSGKKDKKGSKTFTFIFHSEGSILLGKEIFVLVSVIIFFFFFEKRADQKFTEIQCSLSHRAVPSSNRTNSVSRSCSWNLTSSLSRRPIAPHVSRTILWISTLHFSWARMISSRSLSSHQVYNDKKKNGCKKKSSCKTLRSQTWQHKKGRTNSFFSLSFQLSKFFAEVVKHPIQPVFSTMLKKIWPLAFRQSNFNNLSKPG